MSHLKSLFNINPNINTPPSYFPIKQNIKKYSLHKVALPKTYLIDLMFEHGLIYLITINVNTRYLFAELINKVFIDINTEEDTEQEQIEKIRGTIDHKKYISTLLDLINKGLNAEHIISDGEGAFTHPKTKQFYEQHNITHKTVPRQLRTQYPDFMQITKLKSKTNPLHSSLGVIDRVIRTIRDMAFNMKISIITPNIMDNSIKI